MAFPPSGRGLHPVAWFSPPPLILFLHPQPGSLASLTFLEEVDRIIGWGHVFKRSLLLIKVSGVTGDKPKELLSI
jgi:hypothetical protein